jgi:hypothetical protein
MSKTETPAIETADEALARTLASASGAEAYARWLEQMQRSGTRHAAITRNLHSWSSYKNWAEKVRHDWMAEDEKG